MGVNTFPSLAAKLMAAFWTGVLRCHAETLGPSPEQSDKSGTMG